MAVASPPPITITFLYPSSCVGIPSGPTTSLIYSLSSNAPSILVVLPIICTTIVIVPVCWFMSLMVRGIRSPLWSTLSIINCPG